MLGAIDDHCLYLLFHLRLQNGSILIQFLLHLLARMLNKNHYSVPIGYSLI